MKIIMIALVSVGSLLLSGCTSKASLMETPFDYGHFEALNGELFNSAQYAELDKQQDYLAGYKVGLKEFCSQSADDVAWQQVVYQGSCDIISPSFTEQYQRAYSDRMVFQIDLENTSNTYNGKH